MSNIVYPRVRVIGAPGYADFDADLIMEVPSVDGTMMAIVGIETDGKKSQTVVPASCVTQVSNSDYDGYAVGE